ncbi:hypothetical protein [Natronosalvus rutilus]|uniref:Uncharacterized protein n=1 Tax=Natronosalvus rutilus TaxID=2953753 RepID=A0A9E7SWQ6_9EURY|nr:hypothetical protein [Natronosalvus rutilus]UTF55332.1 hypothetical protein NGM29_08805 [Natronosalvus rutilus]
MNIAGTSLEERLEQAFVVFLVFLVFATIRDSYDWSSVVAIPVLFFAFKIGLDLVLHRLLEGRG